MSTRPRDVDVDEEVHLPDSLDDLAGAVEGRDIGEEEVLPFAGLALWSGSGDGHDRRARLPQPMQPRRATATTRRHRSLRPR